MRKVKRWRYYCDFCKKSGGRSLATHEKHCCGNPNRECRMCDRLELVQKPIVALMGALDTSLIALGELAGECPACMLAAIIQRRKRDDYDWNIHETNDIAAWDFKAAMMKANDRANESDREWAGVG